jgi:quinol monooxygenase YgiN
VGERPLPEASWGKFGEPDPARPHQSTSRIATIGVRRKALTSLRTLGRKRLEAGAVSELQGIARFKFHEGKLEEFKRLSAQCMEIVRTKDTGTLQYEIYFDDDQSECIVLERYSDSEALIEHAAHVGDLMETILGTGSVSGELLW